MTSPEDPRKAAAARMQELLTMIRRQPGDEAHAALLDDCEGLARAIGAFHMEAIRFRAYNVDRLLKKHADTLPEAAAETFAQVRRHLEEAGFHTRSHQSPV